MRRTVAGEIDTFPRIGRNAVDGLPLALQRRVAKRVCQFRLSAEGELAYVVGTKRNPEDAQSASDRSAVHLTGTLTRPSVSSSTNTSIARAT